MTDNQGHTGQEKAHEAGEAWTFSDAIIAAHHKSREVGAAYAVQWPLGHSTVELRKPSLRDGRMKVVCCEDGRETLA